MMAVNNIFGDRDLDLSIVVKNEISGLIDKMFISFDAERQTECSDDLLRMAFSRRVIVHLLAIIWCFRHDNPVLICCLDKGLKQKYGNPF